MQGWKVLLAAGLVMVAADAPRRISRLVGDVSGDGIVNVADGVLLSRALAEDLTVAAYLNGPLDYDSDGFLTVSDLHLLLRVLANQPADSEAAREEIRQMTYDYAADPTDAATVEQHLAQITMQDPWLGVTFRAIMDYWDYVNNQMPCNLNGLPDDLPQDDTLCLVVPGYQLNRNGTMQPELQKRLQLALHCAAQYPNAYILCTGGGTAANRPDLSEGGVMAEWLMQQGIATERLIVESRSSITAENALFSHEILMRDYPDVTDIVIMSSDYHAPWAALLFQAEFLLGGGRQSVVGVATCAVQPDSAPYLNSQGAGLRKLLNAY